MKKTKKHENFDLIPFNNPHPPLPNDFFIINFSLVLSNDSILQKQT